MGRTLVPLVEIDDDGLRLDISGVGHLFGGEQGLRAMSNAGLQS
jgi:hypothetical protein